MRPLAISVALAALAIAGVGCGGSLHAARVGKHVGAVAVDPQIGKDIEAGFASYEQALTRWGRWESDEWYGVRWCPDVKHTPVMFVPYRSRGRWTASDRTIGGAPPGSPYWVSDDSDTWGEITMHHGYWVHLDERHPSWCWIPGAEETPGRVVWRTGEGFVGWAPEAPIWVDDGGDGLLADLAWSFVFLGALLEDDLVDQYLDGDAYAAAARSTSAVRSGDTRVAYEPAQPKVGGGERVPANPTVGNAVRVGPPVGRITEARTVLAGYASSHEGKLPVHGLGGSESVRSNASAGTDKSSTSSKKKDDALPGGVVLYAALGTSPMLGPSGLTPRFYAVERPPYAGTIDPSEGRASYRSSGASSTPSYSPSSYASSPSSSSFSSASPAYSSSPSSSSSASSSRGSSPPTSAYSSLSSSSRHSSSSSSSSPSHTSTFHGGTKH